MRIDVMITKGNAKCFDLLTNSLNLFLKEICGVKLGEFLCGYWDSRVLINTSAFPFPSKTHLAI